MDESPARLGPIAYLIASWELKPLILMVLRGRSQTEELLLLQSSHLLVLLLGWSFERLDHWRQHGYQNFVCASVHFTGLTMCSTTANSPSVASYTELVLQRMPSPERKRRQEMDNATGETTCGCNFDHRSRSLGQLYAHVHDG